MWWCLRDSIIALAKVELCTFTFRQFQCLIDVHIETSHKKATDCFCSDISVRFTFLACLFFPRLLFLHFPTVVLATFHFSSAFYVSLVFLLLLLLTFFFSFNFWFVRADVIIGVHNICNCCCCSILRELVVNANKI